METFELETYGEGLKKRLNDFLRKEGITEKLDEFFTGEGLGKPVTNLDFNGGDDNGTRVVTFSISANKDPYADRDFTN